LLVDRSLEKRTAEDDSALLARAQQGDPDAYASLVARYQETAFRAAYLFLGEPAEAEDAVQEGFIRAYRALGRFRLGSPFRPWLLEIVANAARNQRRSAGRREHLVLKLASTAGPDPDLSPESAALAHEQRDVLLGAVNELREEDRMAISCRYFLELSEAETASFLGVARGTVKSRLSRALQRLRDRLSTLSADGTRLAEVNRG
jgi:RNA polymerase sigma-70 factor (ECF subfamily)